MNKTPTSDILNRAADLIEQRGWTSGSSGWNHEEGGPLCLEGGILAAAGLSFFTSAYHSCPAYRAVREYLSTQTSRPPFLWNDFLSHDRVMAAIDRGDTLTSSLEEVRREADEWAASEVVSVLRACAVIEASRERETAEASHA